MVFDVSAQDRHRLFPQGGPAPSAGRYSARPPAASVDALLGLDTPCVPVPPPPPPTASHTPDTWVDFAETEDALDAWARTLCMGAPQTATVPAAPRFVATAAPAAAPRTSSPPPPPVSVFANAAGFAKCSYPAVGDGFDCTLEGGRIVLPPIRWPLLPGMTRTPTAPFAARPLYPAIEKPVRPAATPAATRPAALRPPSPARAPTPLHAALPPVEAAASAPAATTDAATVAPAWKLSDYTIPPFVRAPDERLRPTREFPVLVSDDAQRQVWHYCRVMGQPGVLAGHFEVHALSRADIGGDGRQRRIIVYSRETGAGRHSYQLAMDTHPEGPARQPRIFLMHDAQGNHYRLLQVSDTTRPKEMLHAAAAREIECGGAGDCLFLSVARGLGAGGYNHAAATRLRRMAIGYLYHHPDESLNGDTVALFVSKLNA